jgi:PAS domain S-box-containing protein
MLIALDHRGRVTLASKRASELLGWPEHELLGRDWFTDFVPAPERPRALDTFARLMRGEVASADHVESHVLTRTGQVRLVAWQNRVLRDEAGSVVGTLSSAEDTDRTQALDDLKRSEERYRNLVNTMQEGLGVQDSRGRITFVNGRLCEMVGYSPEELIGRPVSFLFDGDNLRILTDQMARRRTGEHQSFEIAWRCKNGSSVDTLIAPSPQFDETGAYVGSVAVITDVSNLKRAEESLQDANARLQSLSCRLLDIQENERRVLARELHDELGQALTATKIRLQALERFPNPSMLADHLRAAIDVIARSLDQVRSLSLRLRPPLLDDLGLVPALRWLTDQCAQATGIAVMFDSDDGGERRVSPPVETACFRVAQEALTNAARHAECTSVSVSLNRKHDVVHLRVRDNGVGFDVTDALAQARSGGSAGLQGMDERTRLAGGGIEWHSAAGVGTEVHAWFAAPGEPGESSTP